MSRQGVVGPGAVVQSLGVRFVVGLAWAVYAQVFHRYHAASAAEGGLSCDDVVSDVHGGYSCGCRLEDESHLVLERAAQHGLCYPAAEQHF